MVCPNRHDQTYWIPDTIEYFDHEEIEEDEPMPEDAPDDWQPKKVNAPREVEPEELKRVAIEEGQKARYAVAVFENRVSGLALRWLVYSDRCHFNSSSSFGSSIM